MESSSVVSVLSGPKLHTLHNHWVSILSDDMQSSEICKWAGTEASAMQTVYGVWRLGKVGCGRGQVKRCNLWDGDAALHVVCVPSVLRPAWEDFSLHSSTLMVLGLLFSPLAWWCWHLRHACLFVVFLFSLREIVLISFHSLPLLCRH